MIPEGLPTIAQGAHAPDAGEACVMEYVAIIKGEEWTDDPACTDPMVSMVARMVNDRLTDENRAALIIPRVGRLLVARPLEGRHEYEFLTLAFGHVCSWAKATVTDAPVAFNLGITMGEVKSRRVSEGTMHWTVPDRASLMTAMTHVIDTVGGGCEDEDLIRVLDLVLNAHLTVCTRLDKDNRSTVPDEDAVLIKMRDIYASLVSA